MRIVTAEHAGFCFGVQRAIDEALRCAKAAGEPICTYGPLIHNTSAIWDLEQAGVFAIEPEEADRLAGMPKHMETDTPGGKKAAAVPEDAKTVVIRAHGVSRQAEESLRRRFGHVVDATCPFVKKIHRIVAEQSAAGRTVVITGAADHPEVLGIRGWIHGKSYVIADEAQARALPLGASEPVCVVSQTTFHYNKFQDLVEIMKENVYDIVAFNTICNATEERQSEAAAIAQTVDAMLVLGGENSSNSKKLFEICQKWCPNTFFLQTSDDLDRSTLQSFDSIGITAGASTPHYIIEEVQKKCQK